MVATLSYTAGLDKLPKGVVPLGKGELDSRASGAMNEELLAVLFPQDDQKC